MPNVGGPLSDVSPDAGGDLGSPTDPFGPLVNASDPESITPDIPSNFKIRLLSNLSTIVLSVNVLPYSRQDFRGIRRTHIRFYFTGVPIEQLGRPLTPDAISALFKRATLINDYMTPLGGGLISVEREFSQDGTGVYWATQYTEKFGLESQPAGPLSISTDDYQIALDHTPPNVVTGLVGSLAVIPSPLDSLLKFMRVTVTYTIPALQQSFDGIIPVWVDYFTNKVGANVQEGGFYHWDGRTNSTVTFDMQADYNSTGFSFYLTSHTVKLYIVSANEFHGYATPYTSHPFLSFTPGIGT